MARLSLTPASLGLSASKYIAEVMRFSAVSLVMAGIQDIGLDECRALLQQRIVRNTAGGDVLYGEHPERLCEKLELTAGIIMTIPRILDGRSDEVRGHYYGSMMTHAHDPLTSEMFNVGTPESVLHKLIHSHPTAYVTTYDVSTREFLHYDAIMLQKRK